eukprot:scaffold5325_cov183-Amphora_coffeaeformis.AAC.6
MALLSLSPSQNGHRPISKSAQVAVMCVRKMDRVSTVGWTESRWTNDAEFLSTQSDIGPSQERCLTKYAKP